MYRNEGWKRAEITIPLDFVNRIESFVTQLYAALVYSLHVVVFIAGCEWTEALPARCV